MTPQAATSRRRRAFTLVELMVVLTLVAILTVLSVPSFQRAMEHARADIAIANLRAIWSAQRLYWLEHHEYASTLQTLIDNHLLDAAMENTAGGYDYDLDLTDSGFQAVAERTGSSKWSGSFTIDETGVISGSVSALGEREITPGLQ